MLLPRVCTTSALAAVICAAAVAAGCRGPDRHGSRPARIVHAAPPSAPSRDHQSNRPVGTFTITFATFIPSPYVLAPRVHPQSYAGFIPPRRLAFAGDDRGFDVDSPRYRAKQVVTVIPEEAEDRDGLLGGSRRNLGGVSESFVAAPALTDGRIDDRDRGGVLNDGTLLKQGESLGIAEGMIIDDPVRLGPHTVSVRLRTARSGGPRNRLILGSPAIDWSFDVTIDTSGPEPTYQVVGFWEGYPAAELYINGQAVFRSTPGNQPGSFLDLLKLLPGYADSRFVTKGILRRPEAQP